MKKITTIIALVILAPLSLSASSLGTTSAQFLKLGSGARAVGMGGAYTSLGNDADALYWNPAGLNDIDGAQLSAMHALWIEDIYYSNLTFSKEGFNGQTALGVKYLSAGKIKNYDNTGTAGSDYSAYDLAVTFGYAKNIFNIKSGISFKIINSKIEDESAIGAGIDTGIQGKYKFLSKMLNYGVSVRNLGMGLKFNKKRDPLPSILSLATSGSFLKDAFKTAIDINIPFDNSIYSAFGIEYIKDMEYFSLKPRFGLNTKNLNDLDLFSCLSAGMGMSYKNWDIDYVWAPMGEFDSTHRISLLYKF